MITPDLMRIVVVPDEAPKPFMSGQYVAIGLPESAKRPEGLPPEPVVHKPESWIKRAYSIASAPKESGLLEFYISILPTGALSSRLVALQEGDRLFCANKITGTFHLEGVPENSRLIFISTGTGLAPFISMLRHGVLDHQDRKVTVIHGVRYPSDLGYRDELEQHVSTNSRVSYLPVVSRGGDDWKGIKGHVQQVFTNGLVNIDPTIDHIFMCGNPAMIEDLEKQFLEKGFILHARKTPGNLHLEKYW